MKLGKLLVSAIPYGFVAVFAVWQWRMPNADYFNNMMREAPSAPNTATGEVWEIALKGGGVGYITQSDWLLYQSPFLAIPLFVVSALWIMHQLYRAGFYDLFGSR
ncbi:MAG: hypothetical protein AB7Q23_12670 [Hyphomonadaceae bacterium]